MGIGIASESRSYRSQLTMLEDQKIVVQRETNYVNNTTLILISVCVCVLLCVCIVVIYT